MKYKYRVISDGLDLEIETNRRPEIRENPNGGGSVIFLDVDNTLLGYYSQAQSVYLVNEHSDKTDLGGYLYYWKNFGVEPSEKDIQYGEILLVHFRNNGVAHYRDFQQAGRLILDWSITNHPRDIMGVLYRTGRSNENG